MSAADDRKAQRAKEAERKRKEAEKQREADLVWLLNQPQGRRFFWLLINGVGTFSSYAGIDNSTFLFEGRRSVGVDLMAEAQRVATEGYGLMVAEQMRAIVDEKNTKPPAETEPAEE